jgi:hypothetical protein
VNHDNIAVKVEKSSNQMERKERRDTNKVVEVLLTHLSADFAQYPKDSQLASNLVVSLRHLEIHDLLSTSEFKKLLCYASQKQSR